MSETRPGYVDSDYLAVVAQMVAPLKQRTYDLMRLQPGCRVLDVGCGSGADTIPLAQQIATAGGVIGVDMDLKMVAVANQQAKRSKVEAWHYLADGAALPFATGTYDACRCERVFQHLAQPDSVLIEIIRVTKRGGWIVLADTDHSAESIDTSETDIEWRLRRFRADRYRNGYSGRQLYRRLKLQNLLDVTTEIFPIQASDYAFERYTSCESIVEREALAAGVVTEAELERFHTEAEQADANGAYFAYGAMLIAAGRKP
ncbi:MAG: methyltransferase domain-containing protein [Chloroflexota bacterium]